MILDTNAVSALLVGDPGLGEVLAAEQRHHLPVIVIGEYRYGLIGSRHRGHLRRLLETLIRESIVLPVDGARSSIRESAMTRRSSPWSSRRSMSGKAGRRR